MIRQFKNQIRTSLQNLGYHIIPITPKEKVLGLIKSLRPYQTNKNLVRLGADKDGGYLVPDDLDGIQACFSPGVFEVSDFEADCFKYGMQLFLADKSVEKPNLDLPEDKFSFLKKFVGCTNNEEYITMDEWVNSNNIESHQDLLLQMDIEGAEYFTLINMSDSLMKQCRIIVIEFHRLEALWNPEFFGLAEVVFSKLLQTHTCVHIHPNNSCGVDIQSGIQIPRVAEFTFIRNDRITRQGYVTKLPHELDYDNVKDDVHLSLPKIWYKSD